jgi:hypothetical protein
VTESATELLKLLVVVDSENRVGIIEEGVQFIWLQAFAPFGARER